MLNACLAVTCAPPRAPIATPPPEAARKTLTLIATNDVHGHINSLPALAAYVEHVRDVRSQTGGAVILLDAGDLFQGTLETNLTQGSAIIELYNQMGFDAAALGNHEFDYGPNAPLEETQAKDPAAWTSHPQGALKTRLLEAKFPFLSANLIREGDGHPPPWENLSASTLLDRAGVKVGVVGAITAETEEVVKRKLLYGLKVTDPAEAVIREARKLRKDGADVVVAVVHLGGECKSTDDPNDLSSCEQNSELFRFARALPDGLVDAVFGGHRHRAVAHYVEGVPVAQAHWAGRAFSRVDVVLNDQSRVLERRVYPPQDICAPRESGHCDPGYYEGTKLFKDQALAQAEAQTTAELTTVRQRLIGAKCDQPLQRDKVSESALGNLFVDLMRAGVKGADAAIANAGSVRASLPAGPITFGAIYEAMPFDNRLMVASIPAAQLRSALAQHMNHQEHGLAAISGFRARAECENGQQRVSLLREDGTPIADSEILTLVTSDFVATGGDSLLPASLQTQFRDAGGSVRAALIRGLRNLREIRANSKQLHDRANPRIRFEPDLESCSKPQP